LPNYWFKNNNNVVIKYKKFLEMFLRILEEKEGAILKNVSLDKRLLALIREYKEDRRMWFYYIIHQGFNGLNILV
jgi:hypothetical protein